MVLCFPPQAHTEDTAVPVLRPRRRSYTQPPAEPTGVQHSPTPAGKLVVIALVLLLVMMSASADSYSPPASNAGNV
jgi:hypothetical protein